MKTAFHVFTALFLGFVLYSCNSLPPHMKRSTVFFEMPIFKQGQPFTQPGLIVHDSTAKVSLVKFIDKSDSVFTEAVVTDKPPHPFGTGDVLQLKNAAVRIAFFEKCKGWHNCGYPLAVEFDYLDLGGTINVMVDGRAYQGSERVAQYMGTLEGKPVRIGLNANARTKNTKPVYDSNGKKIGERGRMRVAYGSLHSVIIGGKHIYIDNVTVIRARPSALL